jgi:hypothetical protein
MKTEFSENNTYPKGCEMLPLCDHVSNPIDEIQYSQACLQGVDGLVYILRYLPLLEKSSFLRIAQRRCSIF